MGHVGWVIQWAALGLVQLYNYLHASYTTSRYCFFCYDDAQNNSKLLTF